MNLHTLKIIVAILILFLMLIVELWVYRRVKNLFIFWGMGVVSVLIIAFLNAWTSYSSIFGLAVGLVVGFSLWVDFRNPKARV